MANPILNLLNAISHVRCIQACKEINALCDEYGVGHVISCDTDDEHGMDEADEIFDLEASIAAFDLKAEMLALIEFQKLADGDVFKKSPKTIRTRQRASAIVRRFFECKRYSS